MQRSRKALQQRRALEKAASGRNCLYKASLSLVFVLWGLVFLFSLWITCGNGFGDASGEVLVAESNLKENEHGQRKISKSDDEYLTKGTDAYIPSDTLCSDGANTDDFIGDSLFVEENMHYFVHGDKEKYISPNRNEHEVERSESYVKNENDVQKFDRLSAAVPVGLDEFKSRAISSKINWSTNPSGSVIHRVEPGGDEYNYASSSKGAKVLASNKEAKGASNILTRNKDKYLRNPCSSEEKFVVIELSEETLVDTIEIANFEHYSSNLKDFELYGSLIYPTDVWIFLGNFTASNVKQAQRFVLQEPKWVRYLKLNVQSHYGSEFYCTLSIVEVYGVDAVEKMLEDLIYAQDNVEKKVAVASSDRNSWEDDGDENVWKINSDTTSETSSVNDESVDRKNVPDPIEETRLQVGRMPGDTVLKILMEKVRYLDLNLSVLEQYLEDLNSRYVKIFKEYGKEIGEKDIVLQMIREDIKSFLDRQDTIMKDVGDLDSWKSKFSVQLDHIQRENTVLRYEVKRALENQVSLENKAILPPIFFHFRLRRFHQIQLRRCGWVNKPPLVCAHGGDSSNAFPNTIAAYVSALQSRVDCIEIDVSRSSDGVLFALHDRDLQRLSGNTSSRVGYMSSKQIRELSTSHQSTDKINDESIPTIQDALMLAASSVRQIILDVKVGPPLYEKGLAKDVLSIVEQTECRNCIVWAKSDNLARDVIKLSSEIAVGYIVMIEPSTGARSKLLRMKGAEVVGVYHPLIDEKLMKVFHRRRKKVYAWTVDDAESMERLLFEHVDAIVTSNPTLLQRLMQDSKTQCLEEGYSLPD
ncbi:SUN domain-containing protein [Trifolium repens]|nr:SUN domain-containing protein [Trifolium repens]